MDTTPISKDTSNAYSAMLQQAGSIIKSAGLASILYFGISNTTTGQPFIDNCDASPEVIALYQDDADRLAMRRTFRNSTTWMDSARIDPEWSLTALNALVAVHNSTLPERDTVVDLLNIHTFPNPNLRSLIVSAQTWPDWMQELRVGNIPTGVAWLDSIMTDHSLVLSNYYTWPTNYDVVVFGSSVNWNMLGIAALFTGKPGYLWAELNSYGGGGNNITDSVHTDHVSITYSHAWGDCMVGCMYRRYWTFNVFPDCSVEFAGSTGNYLPGYMNIGEQVQEVIRVYPNPVQDILHVSGTGQDHVVSILSSDGRIVQRSKLQAGVLDVSLLSPGYYFLNTEVPDRSAPIPFIKH